MKKIILTTLTILLIGLILTNISCEKLEVKRVTKIKTLDATELTTNSATLNGEFTDLGKSIKDYGFLYYPADNQSGNELTVHGDGSPQKGVFDAFVDGLSPGTEYIVKAYAEGDERTAYRRDIHFTTQSEELTITVTAPTISDVWPKESTQEITWTSNFQDDVNIQLWKKDGTNAYREISGVVSNNGSYNWTVPGTVDIENDYRIKISRSADHSVFAFSDEFDISAALSISIIVPAGGEKWNINSTYNIEWSSNFSDNVDILLFKGGTETLTITENEQNSNQYNWSIPASLNPGTDYKIGIYNHNDQSIYEMSQAFEILDQKNISISSPAGGVDWQMGSIQDITWDDNITENVRIELFKDENLETEIAGNTESDGTHSWTIPTGMVVDNNYTIKITMIGDDNITDESAQFTISEETGSTGTVTDYDANTYGTIKIGAQWWMSENLKVTNYEGGTPIPLIETNALWAALGDNDTDKAYCYYNNNTGGEAATYGALYTYAAATNGTPYAGSNVQGVCPTGWHLPSDAEWTQLTDYLGGESVAGGKMKATGDLTTGDGLWTSPNTGATNESGFSALPGGNRNYDNGGFFSLGDYVNWWSATEASDTYAWFHYLYYNNSEAGRGNHNKSNGFSVRCIKD